MPYPSPPDEAERSVTAMLPTLNSNTGPGRLRASRLSTFSTPGMSYIPTVTRTAAAPSHPGVPRPERAGEQALPGVKADFRRQRPWQSALPS
jgi:hypothetical protein